jgi:hypothetical protein
VNINEIEEKIDRYLYDILDESIPRNKYIYHCNLAYIDIVIDAKVLFTVYEKDYLFSLDYNTFLAHKKLKEEDNFDYIFDPKLYKFAFQMILFGFQYSLLCNVFPLLHAEKATLDIDDNGVISFKIKEIPRKYYKFISDYSIRKTLSYMLQIASGKLQKQEDEDAAMKLMDIYFHFWSENMIYSDFEPYNRLEWGGVNMFFILASMRRFVKLYNNDFDIVKMDSQKMMVLLSPKGAHGLRDYVLTENEEMYQKVVNDYTYKPLGNDLYPKSSVADAPVNKTKDGFMFVNPLVILFSDSAETRFLTYLRKHDNSRYLKIKDKIKERVIPLIQEMIKYKFPNVKVIPNFEVNLPNSNRNKRECDLLIVDEQGYAIYLEIKHFYYPQSFREFRNVDSELKKALEKVPDQLLAIRENWDKLKLAYGIQSDLREIDGVIVSHRYMGYDLEIITGTPIVSSSTLYESIAEAKNIKDVYEGCREIDYIYPSVKFVSTEFGFSFAGFKFNVNLECLDPAFETLFILSQRKQVAKYLSSNTPRSYNNITDLAKAYLKEME